MISELSWKNDGHDLEEAVIGGTYVTELGQDLN